MKKILMAAFLLLIYSEKTLAQGCSDAGFCSIHSIKNNTESGKMNQKKNELVIGFDFGKGERSTSVYSSSLEYTRSLSARTSVTGKLVYSSITGELANTSGLGDLFLSASHTIHQKRKWQKSFIAGIKLPFDRSDIIKKGIHLPMPYQTSLGTTDLIAGVNFTKRSFGATLALQQPLQSENGNHFIADEYPSNSLAVKYLSTNQFSRKADLLLRTSYNIEFPGRFSIRPSLLGIYHIDNDSYLDNNKTKVIIPDSKGLTLNGNVFVGYKANQGEFELSLATPFIIRENRPDGLTRSFVAALSYKFSF